MSDEPTQDTMLGDGLDERLYASLHGIAQACMRSERAHHTLQPTALVSEAYLRMSGGDGTKLNRAMFLGRAARIMRQVLVDHARGINADKRGGGRQRMTLSGVGEGSNPDQAIDVIGIHDALERLADEDERLVRVVECRFFGGLTISETAELLGMSASTIEADWRFAKAWLKRELDA
ncbi:MAG: ECF-type sigma factor [Planctomycetota bacterium]